MSLRLNQILGGADIRSPIFYDSNDTAYYLDPASTSKLNILSIGTGAISVTGAATATDRNLKVKGASSTGVGIVLYDSSDNFRCQLYGEASNYGFLNGLWASWDIKKTISGNLYLNDSTTYYLNTVSTSALYDLTLIGSKNTYLYINPGNGYEAMVRYNGGSGNGWYVGKRVTSQLVGTESFHFYSEAAGATVGGIDTSGNTFSTGSFRAPIFYDSNDTNYYCDPASTTRLNNLTIIGTTTFGTLAYTTESRRSKNSLNVDIETVTGLVSPSGPTFLEIRGFCPPTMYRTTGDRPAPYGLGFGNGSESGGIMPIGAGDNLQEIMLYGANSGPTTFTFKRQIWEATTQDPAGSNYYGSAVFSINTGTGAVTASTDIRSPIFYDNNNTNYYVDPASTTNLLTLSVDRINNLRPYVDTWHTSTDGTRRFFFANSGTTYYSTANNYVFRNSSDIGVVTIDGSGNLRTSTSGDNYASYSLHVGGTGFATADFRTPIFYDSNNTAFYVDPASTSVLNRLTIDGGNYANNYFQSLSDFTNGTLVTTDIPATAANGLSFVMNVVGKSYNTTTSPFNFSVQGYLYNSTIINYSGLSLDSTGLSTIKIFENGGFLCFWWARVSYWNAFEVSVRSYDTAKTNYNRVTNITDAVEPTGTKKVTVILQTFMRGDVSATNAVDLRAPIFYDSDNTSYYLNPAGNSQLTAVFANDWFRAQGNTGLYFQDKGYGITSAGGASNSYGNASTYGSGLNGWQGWGIGSRHCMMSTGGDNFGIHDNTRSWLYYWDGTYHRFQYGYLQSANSVRGPIFYDSDNTVYYCDPASTSNLNAITAAGNITAAQYYTGGWFRNNGSGNGLYNESTGEHFYSDAADMWNIASANGTQGLRLRTGGHNGTIRGYFYANDSNDVGFLNQSGNWRVRVVGGDYVLFDGSSIRGQIFYDTNDTNYYCDPASTTNLNVLNIVNGNLELYKSQTVDMSNTTTYSTSNYYPVTISVPTEGCIIQIQNNLNSNVPSWATHAAGFTLNLKWRTNGSGWGTTQVKRIVDQYYELFTNQTICGGITQMTNSSIEVVWLRGGGQYFFKFSRNLSATAQSATYTTNSQSVTPTSIAQNTIWNAANGSGVLYNDTTYSTSNMYTPVLYDYNNSTYYVDPASTSNLVGLTVANTITGSVSGNSATSTTLATARTFTIGSTGKTFNGGADVSWSINEIVGYTPAYGTAAYQSKSLDTITTPGLYQYDGVFGGTKPPDNSANYRTIEIGSGARFSQIAMPWNSDGYYFRRYDGTSFSTWRTVLHDGNYNSYSPTLTGTGASGSWGISVTGSSASCTGNAATATNLSTNRTNWSTNGTISAVVGQLSWKNYNNNHTIFDASNSTAPDGTSKNNTNPDVAWTGTYPTLMGWNGANTYGVRVDSSRYADQVSYSPSRTDSTTYPILWGAGSTYTIAYSCASVYIQSSTGTIYANAFYDAGNTAYYVDPASTSNLVGLTVANTITGNISGNAATVSGGVYTTGNQNISGEKYFQSNLGTTSGSLSSPPLQAYATGTNAAFMSFHRAGNYAVNMGLDSDNVLRIGGWSAAANRLQLDMSGNLTLAGVVDATQFRDSANTSYYLDPASTSILNLVRTRNTFGERVAVTSSSSTTVDTQYNVTELTMSASITTLTLSNIQSSTISHMWTIVTVGNGTAYSITWPAAVKWPGGTAPTITSTNTKKDIYQFITFDGGTNIYAIIVGQNL